MIRAVPLFTFIPMEHAVEFKNITKRFGSVVANNAVNLYLDRGIIMSLLGENGSGKTTLLNIIGGLDVYDSGDLIINNTSTKKYNDRRNARRYWLCGLLKNIKKYGTNRRKKKFEFCPMDKKT